MTMIDSIRQLQTQYIEGMRSAQEQFVSYNERVADTISGSVPNWSPPFADYLPKPTEVVDAYYSFVGELHETNRDFATRVAQAWARPEDQPADS